MMVYAPHNPNQEQLAEVKSQMQTLGAPVIRAWYSGDAWYAIEGSHRLAAAYDLGLTPNMIEIDYDAEITGHDFCDIDDTCTVADIINYLYDRPESCYQF
jgi:outer membrane protein assembly factor BamE (lipoprotein component of BamABCDE complex)